METITTKHQCQVIVKDPEKTQDPAGIWTQDLLITSQHVHDSNDPQKDRQGNTTQQKEKATQHNSSKAVIFSCLGWDLNLRPSAVHACKYVDHTQNCWFITYSVHLQ